MSRKRGESRTGALVDDKNKKSDGRREKRRAKVGRSSRGEKIKCAEEEAHEVKKEEEGREKESEKRRIEIKGLGGGREVSWKKPARKLSAVAESGKKMLKEKERGKDKVDEKFTRCTSGKRIFNGRL